MELPSKLEKHFAFFTRPKNEEHILPSLAKSTHEEHLSPPLHINNKQHKLAVTSLSGYNAIFNFTNNNKKLIFISAHEGAEYNVFTPPPGVYEIESLKAEIN